MEEWRNIDKYEGLYQVSNCGRVRSLDRIDCLGRLKKGKVLKPYKDKYGYLRILLYKNGRCKAYLVHRLVAQAFLNNPDNLPCINHRDECKTNNHIDNLEFCSYQYNNTYGTRIEQMVKKKINGKQSKKVFQYTLDGEFVAEYPSTMEVQRQLGYSRGNISLCCNGKYKQSYGYIWKYN